MVGGFHARSCGAAGGRILFVLDVKLLGAQDGVYFLQRELASRGPGCGVGQGGIFLLQGVMMQLSSDCLSSLCRSSGFQLFH